MIELLHALPRINKFKHFLNTRGINMIKVTNYLLGMFSGISLVTNVHAKTPDPNDYAFMTASDIQRAAVSNITITNQIGTPITVSGLFIASFDINDCSSCFGNIVAGDNLGGAVVSPVTFKTNQTLSIGQNYLYNMLYNGIYYIKNTSSSPCALPGCSWPGDNPYVQGWCITINAISPNSSYTYSHYTNGSNPPANTPAYSNPGNSISFNYKYDLIDPSTLGSGNACLGPITCNDETLTCKVATTQNESFQPY